jgi:hypothetical protein
MRALTIFSVLLISCASINFFKEDVEGTYVQQEAKNLQLVFKGNAFAYVDTQSHHMSAFSCCDTIAYGSWSIDKERGLIELSSPQALNTSVVNIEVKEKELETSDTVSFYINNPLEKFYRSHTSRYTESVRDILYIMYIYSDDGLITDVSTRLFNTNYIKIPKSNLGKVLKFEIQIIPKHNFGGRNIGTRSVTTLEYEIRNGSSNFFEVNIPQLDYGYLSYLRLNKDIVKILNKSELEWDGHKYSKK